jgi:RimJ/RimL family protein N-acetyltransferase
MIGAAEKCGFVLEGRLRASAWVAGEFIDEVLLGLLDREWRENHPA